jgi:hypothetical protein
MEQYYENRCADLERVLENLLDCFGANPDGDGYLIEVIGGDVDNTSTGKDSVFLAETAESVSHEVDRATDVLWQEPEGDE